MLRFVEPVFHRSKHRHFVPQQTRNATLLLKGGDFLFLLMSVSLSQFLSQNSIAPHEVTDPKRIFRAVVLFLLASCVLIVFSFKAFAGLLFFLLGPLFFLAAASGV